LKEKLVGLYEVKDPNCIFVFKFRTHFGGGKSTRFDLIYDNLEAAKNYEAFIVANTSESIGRGFKDAISMRGKPGRYLKTTTFLTGVLESVPVSDTAFSYLQPCNRNYLFYLIGGIFINTNNLCIFV
jgi:Ribosomal protein S24e